MEITYKTLSKEDLPLLKELILIFAEVFEMEKFELPNDEHLQNFLENESMVFFVALHKNKVVGGVRIYILPSTYYANSEVYLYDVGVTPTFQRKGIGVKLIENIKEYSKNLGYQEIFVQADLEDTHAINFYKKTGGKAADVVHFTYQL